MINRLNLYIRLNVSGRVEIAVSQDLDESLVAGLVVTRLIAEKLGYLPSVADIQGVIHTGKALVIGQPNPKLHVLTLFDYGIFPMREDNTHWVGVRGVNQPISKFHPKFEIRPARKSKTTVLAYPLIPPHQLQPTYPPLLEVILSVFERRFFDVFIKIHRQVLKESRTVLNPQREAWEELFMLMAAEMKAFEWAFPFLYQSGPDENPTINFQGDWMEIVNLNIRFLFENGEWTSFIRGEYGEWINVDEIGMIPPGGPLPEIDPRQAGLSPLIVRTFSAISRLKLSQVRRDLAEQIKV